MRTEVAVGGRVESAVGVTRGLTDTDRVEEDVCDGRTVGLVDLVGSIVRVGTGEPDADREEAELRLTEEDGDCVLEGTTDRVVDTEANCVSVGLGVRVV